VLIALIFGLPLIGSCKTTEHDPISNSDSVAPRQSLSQGRDEPPPEPLQTYLRNHAGSRLPTVNDTEWKEDFLRGEFRPFVSVDTNRDRIPDLVAVVAIREKFSVLVFHGGQHNTFEEPIALMRDIPQTISGLVVDTDGTIGPVLHWRSDYNVHQFRWSGRAYSEGLFFTNETPCLMPGASVYAAPDANAQPTFSASKKSGENALVLAMPFWTADRLWYKVRLTDVPEQSGFVQGKDLAVWEGPCKWDETNNKMPATLLPQRGGG
jgi:hypothetical protein